jgi:NADPH:quinone reductase-like Zn-dependent oxidoreductase
MASSTPSIPATHSEYRRTGSTAGVEGGITLHKDVPVPKPGRGQVLVRVRATSLNYRDLLILRGQYSTPSLIKQGIPVSDAAGEVVALGEGVTDWKIGSRVAALFNPKELGGNQRYFSMAGSLGGDAEGVLAHYIVVDDFSLVDIGPSGLTFEEAATLPCAGVTAWNALYAGAIPLRAGRTVLVQGTGGVSILAAQLALAAGARVIATSSSDDKLARLEKLGVAKSDLINYKTTPEWSAKVLELTGGLGVDYVIEVGGPGTIQQSISSVRIGGEVALIGMVAGFQGKGVDPLTVLMKGATMRGVLVGNREMFREMLEAIAINKLKPVIDKVFPFEQALDAFRYLESAQHFGKIVIQV